MNVALVTPYTVGFDLMENVPSSGWHAGAYGVRVFIAQGTDVGAPADALARALREANGEFTAAYVYSPSGPGLADAYLRAFRQVLDPSKTSVTILACDCHPLAARQEIAAAAGFPLPTWEAVQCGGKNRMREIFDHFMGPAVQPPARAEERPQTQA